MNAVRELRRRAGVAQKDFAVAIGVARPTVSEWEHQKKDPSGERLFKIADYFRVSTGVVLCYEPIPDQNLEGIDFALSGEIHDLTEQEKQDLLDMVKMIKARRES